MDGRRAARAGRWLGAALMLMLASGLDAEPQVAADQPPAGSREITGRVRDGASGEPLEGVLVAAGSVTATTAADGFFRLAPPPAARSLVFTAAGYFDTSIPLPAEGEVAVAMAPQTFEEAVEVTAEAPELGRPAATRVAPREVLETAGTVDNIFRALTTLPGVAPTSDFGSFLSVRGGTPDQNLTLMDGIEIHDPYRLFGLASAFNPETVADFSLAAGGFGAKYGDRLSSLLIVRNRAGNRDFGATSALSVTDANLVLEGPLPGGSWLATARRTFYDLIAGRILDQNFPSFGDFQLRADWEFGPGHRLSLIGLRSREDTDFSFDDEDEGESAAFLSDVESDLAAARFDALLSDRFTSTTTLSWYRNAGTLDFEGLFRTDDRAVNSEEAAEGGPLTPVAFERTREVRDLSFRQELGLQLGDAHFVETGLELHGLDTGLRQSITGARNESAANPTSMQGGSALPDLLDSDLSGVRGGAWIQDTFRLSERLSLEPGARLEWSTINRRATLSPRAAAIFDFGGGVQVRAAGGGYTQSPGWEKLTSSDYFLDLGGIRDLEHERALHAVVGVEKRFSGGTRVRLEGYWKRFEGLLVGRLETESERLLRVAAYDFPQALAANVPTAAEITVFAENGGGGVSRGLDFYLERLDPAERVAGWISYSFGKAERETYGQRYPFEYDRPHALNLVGRVRITDRLGLAATARLASGFPYTPAVGVRVAAAEDARGQLVPETDEEGNLAYLVDFGGLGNLNSGRLPSYARLDLRLTYRHGGADGRWSVYAEVINALNRRNAVAMTPTIVVNPAEGIPTIEEDPSGGLPRVPTVGVRFRF